MSHITEVKEQAEFWAHRVIKEFKDKYAFCYRLCDHDIEGILPAL
jgi:hypothetical protein